MYEHKVRTLSFCKKYCSAFGGCGLMHCVRWVAVKVQNSKFCARKKLEKQATECFDCTPYGSIPYYITTHAHSLT
jgi:hypothetical protein